MGSGVCIGDILYLLCLPHWEVVKILLLEKVEDAVWISVIDIISQVESNTNSGI